MKLLLTILLLCVSAFAQFGGSGPGVSNPFGNTPWVDVRAYGVVGNGTTDDVTAFNSAATAACNSGVALLVPSGFTVEVKSRPAAFACGLNVVAANFNSTGSAYSYGAFIKCDYNDPGTSGCLTWSGSAAGTKGNGGGLWGINIRVTSGNTIGAALAAPATDCTSRPGNLHFVGFKIAADGTGLWDYGIYADGSACTTSGTQGVRDIWVTDGEIFSAVTDAIYFKNCVHCSVMGVTTSPGNGVGDVAVTGAGSGTSASTDVRFANDGIFGNVALDFATQVVFASTLVTGNFSTTANTTVSYNGGNVVVGTYTNTGNVPGSVSSGGQQVLGGTAVVTPRLLFSGSAPTCTATGIGAAGTCTLASGSSDSAGIILLGTDSSGTAATGNVTLTFTSTWAVNSSVCTFALSQVSGAWNARATIMDSSGGSASDRQSWDNNSVALSTGTTYRINYHCFAK